MMASRAAVPATCTANSQAVPDWADLPSYAQDDLGTRKFNADWFENPKKGGRPDLRLTVLVCYVKLRSMYLWGFVEEEHSSFPGALQFKSSYSRALKAVLTRRADFTDPEASDDAWSSREKRSIASLHFKKFSGSHFVQAHLDYFGLLASNSAWVFPPIQAGQALAHAFTPKSFTDVFRLRQALLDQGWDRAPLIGVAAARCHL